MSEHPLMQRYSGYLLVIIYQIWGSKSCNLKFEDATLFEYVSEACREIFGRKIIRSEDWEIVYFLPDQGVLKVKEIMAESLVSRLEHLGQYGEIPEDRIASARLECERHPVDCSTCPLSEDCPLHKSLY